MTNSNFCRKPYEGTFNAFVDDLFSDIPYLFKNEFNNTEKKGFVPANVKETDKNYKLELVVPGFEKTDFNVLIDQNLLAISAEVKEQKNQEGEKQIRREYSFRSFKRSFTLDEKIDATNIEASYINGVLILNLPKKEAVNVSAKEIVIK
jgi:HSP20 family protein